MSSLANLFERNRKWAARLREQDPGLFDRLTEAQTPRYLWIGCSDSRVPANQIVDLPPGSVFVHRNIANVVHHADLNVVSVLQFAVQNLGVRDVIVCGHYGCGGVAAAMADAVDGPIAHWLREIRELYVEHHVDLDAMDSETLRARRLSELNVLRQVRNVACNPIIEDAWRRGHRLTVHGVIYGIEDGHLHDLGLTISRPVHR